MLATQSYPLALQQRRTLVCIVPGCTSDPCRLDAGRGPLHILILSGGTIGRVRLGRSEK